MKRYVSCILGFWFSILGISAQNIATFDFTIEGVVKKYYPGYSEDSRDFKKIRLSPVVIESSFVNANSGFWLIKNKGQMRIFKKDAITISVQEGYSIQSIRFIGGNLPYLQYNSKNFPEDSTKQCTLMNFADTKSVRLSSRGFFAYIYKIIVTYSGEPNTLLLSQNNDNQALLHTYLGKKVTATLVGRKLSSAYWNTFCVPFDVDVNQVKAVFGENVEIREFSSVRNSTLLFTKTTYLEAGRAYLIKVDVDNPTFADVIIKMASPIVQTIQGYSFIGTFGSYEMATDGTELFFYSEDKLYKPIVSDKIIYGFRAFIKTGQAEAKVAFVDQATKIDKKAMGKEEDVVYSISGIKMNGGNLPSGIYIKNGKKFVVK